MLRRGGLRKVVRDAQRLARRDQLTALVTVEVPDFLCSPIVHDGVVCFFCRPPALWVGGREPRESVHEQDAAVYPPYPWLRSPVMTMWSPMTAKNMFFFFQLQLRFSSSLDSSFLGVLARVALAVFRRVCQQVRSGPRNFFEWYFSRGFLLLGCFFPLILFKSDGWDQRAPGRGGTVNSWRRAPFITCFFWA